MLHLAASRARQERGWIDGFCMGNRSFRPWEKELTMAKGSIIGTKTRQSYIFVLGMPFSEPKETTGEILKSAQNT